MNRRKFIHLSALAGAASSFSIPLIAESKKKQEEMSLFGCGDPFVFRLPEDGYDYIVGVVAEYDPEPSVISVFRKGRDGEPLLQVAEWMGLQGNNDLMYLCLFCNQQYSQYLPSGPLFSIEQLTSHGDLLQHQLKMEGVRRFYKTMRYNGSSGMSTKEGWYTNKVSRPIMMSRLKLAVAKENGWVVVKSDLLKNDIANATNSNRVKAAAIAVSSI